MSRKVKILLSLIAAALLIVLYIIFTSEPIEISKMNTMVKNQISKNKSAAEKINLKYLSSKYRQETAKILNDYYELEAKNNIKSASTSLNSFASSTDEAAASGDFSTSTQAEADKNKSLAIINLKDRLLALKVPAQYQNLHINLVLAFDKLEKYFKIHNNIVKLKAENIFKKAREQYNWLAQGDEIASSTPAIK